MPDRLAVDIGGTFTDVVLETAPRRLTTKVLTTHADPAHGVMDALAQVLDQAGTDPGDIGLVLHGTTLATNALIERRGARTALITTEGHRDVLEMAFENRFEQYDVNVDRPQPLVPRRWRLTVSERMNAAGEVLTPLQPAAVEALVPRLLEADIESVAVGFLHAYADPAHERLVRDVLGTAVPDLSITLASDVCPEIREFERFSTACANAYVKPLMSRYLADLGDRLTAFGVGCPFLMMTSGGGLTSVATAREFPIRLVESGPAGGAILAAQIARELGLPRVVSLDMGGTTAKICMIDDGAPLLSRSFEVDRSYRFKKGSGLPVRIPVVEMVEIGAGGGSLASVDRLGRIQVGPQSAGSEPGPACYGRGGTNATVTDADVVLDRIDPKRFAGGTLHLDVGAARAVVRSDVAKPWGQSVGTDGIDAAAGAISEVVDENMAAAARAHAAEWGKEIGSRTLIAFGGAAPIHAANIADKLELDAVLVPPAAGVGSAVGFLAAPVAYEVVRSRYLRLSSFEPRVVDEVMAEMRAEAETVVGPLAEGELVESRRAYMRYVGQGFEIAVDVGNSMAEDLRRAFDAAYVQLYGRLIPGLDVEILSWTLTLLAVQPGSATPTSSPRALSRGRAGSTSGASRIAREGLAVGDRVVGPVAIVEDQTTTVVPVGFDASVDVHGNVILRRSP
ncbi:MAG: hydantoinase/oxoprolinase family protein [Gammaproteobacteria bacterium]|nr:hydantoinase/oxoprolinase family protein [Gammaproteobacteria bacterium]